MFRGQAQTIAFQRLQWYNRLVMSKPHFGAALSLQQLEAVLDAVSDAVVTMNRDYVITSFNRAAEQATGSARTDAIGRLCSEILSSFVCQHVGECPMTQLLAADSASITRQYSVSTRHAEQTLRSVSVYPLRDGLGRVVGGIETFRSLQPAGASSVAADAVRGIQLLEPTGARILETSQRRVIEEVLRRHRWNRSAACEELGLSRTTLWRKMRRLGIRPQPPREA